MLFGVFLYFLLVVPVLALLCLPLLRQRAADGMASLWQRSSRNGVRWRRAGAQRLARQSATLQDHRARLTTSVSRHARALGAALLVVLALPLAALWLRSTYRVDSFDPDTGYAVNERVAALLQGEDLVPPAPLPPAFFVTREVEDWQPLASSASRQWHLLDNDFRQRLLLSFKLLRAAS